MISEDVNGKSASETSGADKNLHKMSKQLINQPVNCPWTSRAPITTVGGVRNPFPGERSSANIQMSHFPHNSQSSNHFFHFLRLMQLFPEVHPATLHTVMILCKNDFFTAVDRLLYAKRCKNILAQRRNLWTPHNTDRTHQNSFTSVQKGYIKVSVNRQCNHEPNTKVCLPNTAEVFRNRPADSRRLVYKNRYRSRAPKTNADLPLAVTPQYTVPIQPLSPALTISQNDN